jgi:DNA-binding NarL/FixJ family response regulator
MKDLPKNASFQLLRVIKNLRQDANFLNNNEFIMVVSALKTISKNQKFVDNLIKSFKVLEQTEIHLKGHLTKREKQVLLLVGEGLKSNEIASDLNLSKSTVESHRKNIRKKLKLNRMDNLFALALLFSIQYDTTTNDYML